MQHVETSDGDLMQRFVNGDEEAFTTIVLRYEHVLFVIACRMLVDANLAQDVCQNTWIQLFLKKPLRSGVPLRSWLVTVVSRRCLDEIRRKKRSALLFSFLEQENEDQDSFINSLLDPQALPEQITEDRESFRLVHCAVMNLPELYRVPLFLRVFEEYTFREIAHRLCEPEATIKTRFFRGQRLLRKEI